MYGERHWPAWVGIAFAAVAIVFFAVSWECTSSSPGICSDCYDLGGGMSTCDSYECEHCERYEWRWW